MNTKRIKLSKGLFLLNGVTSILIGLLHTYAHFDELVTPAVKSTLDKPLVVMGADSNIWNLWQGMSFMMGHSFVLFGITHLVIGLRLNKDECPPIPFIILMMISCAGAVYTGYYFFGPAQLYGGLFGILCLAISLFLTIKTRNHA